MMLILSTFLPLLKKTQRQKQTNTLFLNKIINPEFIIKGKK